MAGDLNVSGIEYCFLVLSTIDEYCGIDDFQEICHEGIYSSYIMQKRGASSTFFEDILNKYSILEDEKNDFILYYSFNWINCRKSFGINIGELDSILCKKFLETGKKAYRKYG